jgi:hypothetical protein
VTDSLVRPGRDDAPDDPAAVVAVRGSVRLALVAALQVLTAAVDGIAGITAFRDPGLFRAFGLPEVLDRPVPEDPLAPRSAAVSRAV